MLSGVVAWASGKGTKDAWMTAWGPLVEAATHGAPDVAGAAAPRTRPRRWAGQSGTDPR